MKYELPDGILAGKRGTEEYHLQVAFVDYLRGEKRVKNKPYYIKRPFPQLFDDTGHQKFTCIYQNRDPKEGFFLQRLGLRRGPLDLFFWPGPIFFIDMKIGSNPLSREQQNFCRHMENLDIKTFTATTVEEGRDILIAQGLRCENELVNEPAMTPEAKQKAYLAMMAPL